MIEKEIMPFYNVRMVVPSQRNLKHFSCGLIACPTPYGSRARMGFAAQQAAMKRQWEWTRKYRMCASGMAPWGFALPDNISEKKSRQRCRVHDRQFSACVGLRLCSSSRGVRGPVSP